MKYQFAFYIILGFTIACSSESKNTNNEAQLGQIEHEFTVSETSKKDFNKGLLLLHSFEYEDAREAFQAASLADSAEMMAYWGEAMTHYRALWGLQDVPAGQEVLVKAGMDKTARLAKTDEGLERDFWLGLEILFGEGELKERNEAYAEHMAELYEKYEGNQEVAAFYALGLMWALPPEGDDNILKKSSAVAAGILEENPLHPGGLHYMIHANDNPDFAINSKEAADQYAKVAPDAAHALHMPSHIYLSLGMWNNVVASNEVSYAASLKRMERKGLDDKARGYHSYAWLHYGYLQQGRYKKANELLKDMQGYTEITNFPNSNSYLIYMQNAQRIESGNWDNNLKPMEVDYSKLSLTSKAQQHFFKALLAFDNNNAQNIKLESDTLETLIIAAELVVTESGIALCNAGPTRYAPKKSNIIHAQVMLNQMKAMKAMLENDDDATEQYYKKAITLEWDSQYSYGPPNIPLPSFEQYGEWLMSKNRPKEALEQFNKSLERAPKRARALLSKVKSLELLNRTDEANETRQILKEFWQNS